MRTVVICRQWTGCLCLCQHDLHNHHVIIWTSQNLADILQLFPRANIEQIHVDGSDRKMLMPPDLNTGVCSTKTEANCSTVGDPSPLHIYGFNYSTHCFNYSTHCKHHWWWLWGHQDRPGKAYSPWSWTPSAGWTQKWSCCDCVRQCRQSTPTRRHLAPQRGCNHSQLPERPWPSQWNCEQRAVSSREAILHIG